MTSEVNTTWIMKIFSAILLTRTLGQHLSLQSKPLRKSL